MTCLFLDFSAQNIHTEADWDIVFTILECVGAGATPPEFEEAIVPNIGKLVYHYFIDLLTVHSQDCVI